MTLSPRQQEILELVGRDGMSYKATAKALKISISTIRTHIDRIIERVGIHDRCPRMALAALYWREINKPKHQSQEIGGTPTGFVYAIATTERPKRLKIGYTTDIGQRLRTLSTASPVGLCLLASWPGSKEDEAKLHEIAKAHRLHGEWFSMDAFEVVKSVMPSADSENGD